MSLPVVDPTELGTYLNDTSINLARAEMMIGFAQDQCESVVSPLPVAAKGIVMRIAARGYVSTTQARSPQLAAAGSPFGSTPGGASGVYLTAKDEYDLTRIAQAASVSGVAAFTIRTRPRPVPFDAAVLPARDGYGGCGTSWWGL